MLLLKLHKQRLMYVCLYDTYIFVYVFIINTRHDEENFYVILAKKKIARKNSVLFKFLQHILQLDTKLKSTNLVVCDNFLNWIIGAA